MREELPRRDEGPLGANGTALLGVNGMPPIISPVGGSENEPWLRRENDEERRGLRGELVAEGRRWM